MFDFPILSLLIFLPLIAIGVILTIRGESLAAAKNIKNIAILTSFINLILSVYLWYNFDKVLTNAQFVENIQLIPTFNFGYSLGVDGISLLFILVSSILFLGVFLFVSLPKTNVKLYVISLLIIMSAAVGTFASLDIVMFYVFYEFSIIPVFFIMGVFGSGNKIYTTFKFFLYTVFGSMFMIIAILFLVIIVKDTNIANITAFNLPYYSQQYLFWAMFIGFAVKSALFPVHTWAPDTYESSPLYLNIILSGVLMKYGVYGFIKFVLPFFPLAILNNLNIIYFICLITVIYCGLIASQSTNIKRLFAYLSVSHVALMVAGIFSAKTQGVEGAIFQALSHSIYNLGIFLALIYLQKRVKSSQISNFSGIASVMPKFAIVFVILSLAAMAFPLTNAFIGEILILFGIFQDHRLFSAGFALSMIISAIVIIPLLKKFLFLETSSNLKFVKDLSMAELLPLLIIIFVIIFMGIHPDMFLDIIHTNVASILDQFKSEIISR